MIHRHGHDYLVFRNTKLPIYDTVHDSNECPHYNEITRTSFRYLCCVVQTTAVCRPHHIYLQATATVLASERNLVDFLQENVCSNLSYKLEFFNTDTSKSDNPLFISYMFTDDCNLLNVNWIHKKYTTLTTAVQNVAKRQQSGPPRRS
jgi:hypothetical protein